VTLTVDMLALNRDGLGLGTTTELAPTPGSHTLVAFVVVALFEAMKRSFEAMKRLLVMSRVESNSNQARSKNMGRRR